MIDIPCVIFAGGKSSRMGEDKALLPFGEFDTLTQFQLSRLKKIFKNVYISCRDSNKFNFDADFIEDISKESSYAPTAGFISVFQNLHVDKFFAISVDVPFIDEKEILKIIESDKEEVDATVAKTEYGLQPMCGVYHRSLEDKFVKMSEEDNHKLGFLLKSSKTNYIEFDDDRAFLNINNPKEYKKALTLI